jgi:hypothetical protein
MSAKTKQLTIRMAALIAILAIVLFGGLGITGAAAQTAIPGDALYTVKTSIEQTRLSLSRDAGNRAELKLSFAEKRLGEIEALVKEGRYREVGDAVLAFEDNINSALIELEALSKIDPERTAVLAREITESLSRYAKTLSELVAGVPEIVKEDVSRALDSAKLANEVEKPSINDNTNSNGNANDDNANGNLNDNSADDNSNANSNDDDDNSNANSNDDDDDNYSNSNSNSDDDSNSNSNSNSDDDSGSNNNDNSDDGDNDNSNDDNSNDDADDNDNGGNDNSNGG